MPSETSEIPPEPSFETAIMRLETIVDRIETEELELDESLALFEEGISLLRVAGRVLAGAEEKVQQLLDADDGGVRLQPFAEDG